MNTKNTGTKEINYVQFTVRFGGWIEVTLLSMLSNVKTTNFLVGKATHCLLMATWSEIIQKLHHSVSATTQKSSFLLQVLQQLQ